MHVPQTNNIQFEQIHWRADQKSAHQKPNFPNETQLEGQKPNENSARQTKQLIYKSETR